eukprot:scaffold3446_cov393-Prasinococcus_capsulatus_cf.AAC.1
MQAAPGEATADVSKRHPCTSVGRPLPLPVLTHSTFRTYACWTRRRAFRPQVLGLVPSSCRQVVELQPSVYASVRQSCRARREGAMMRSEQPRAHTRPGRAAAADGACFGARPCSRRCC